MEFLAAPDAYYDSLREGLKSAKIKVKEDLNKLQVSHGEALPSGVWNFPRLVNDFRGSAMDLGMPDYKYMML